VERYNVRLASCSMLSREIECVPPKFKGRRFSSADRQQHQSQDLSGASYSRVYSWSTNVWNAFKLIEPLKVIAEVILQGKPQLLLSSEWDYVAYPQSLEDLRSFVLIGLPSSEAANAYCCRLRGTN
jgi:hypothetical protein